MDNPNPTDTFPAAAIPRVVFEHFSAWFGNTPADDVPGRGQLEQRLSDGGEADPELRGVLVLGWEAVAGSELARRDLAEDRAPDLVMQRCRARSTDGQRRHCMRL